jgi:hypothetical protein
MRSGNLLNCNRFQFISSEDFCQLPFLTASCAQKKGIVLLADGSSTCISPSGYAFGL